MKLKLQLIMVLTLGFSISLFAQNTAENILGSDEKLIIGGYGQIYGNFNLDDDNKMNSNGKLDVHRLVTFLGYKFNDKITFVSEVEYEHIVELYVEQAFLDYKIKDNMSLQAGLMLIPMGIQNLYHEPPTFNGVERTNVDKYIVPTTWREIGVGLSGRLDEQSLNYQLMVVNGPLGYDNGVAKFSGSKGIRSGRQKGAEAIVSDFDFAGRVSYYGMLGWNFGASFYKGNSETTDFEKFDHILISIKNNINLDNLISKIKDHLKNKFISSEDILITRARHRQHLEKCLEHLKSFNEKNEIEDFDKAAEDLRLATRNLGMIVGKVDVEELLGSIFNDFCIGK